MFGGGGGTGGCQGDPTGKAVPLEGLVNYQREGLPLHLVRCCSAWALQWLQWLVQVHLGWEARHYVLQWESRGGVGQLRYPQHTPYRHDTGADMFSNSLSLCSPLLMQNLAVSSWRSCSEQEVRWNQWRPVSPFCPVWVPRNWQWATGPWPAWKRARSPFTTQMDSRPPS